MKTIIVEFIGLSRVLSGQKKLELQTARSTTYRDIIKIIGARFPALLGQVVTPDGGDLCGSNMFNLNGEYMLQDEDMDKSPEDGCWIILMSVLAGG